MFFIMGISPRREELDFNQTVVCSRCGKYGRYNGIREYTALSLFFIPVLKWGKKYYVRSSCCGSVYSIEKDLGDRIVKGENITLRDVDLSLIHGGEKYHGKRCAHCNFQTHEDFTYCPKCGTPFE
ncbi:zinc ribbon domain-containing protein [Alkaliphilus oremlandii]|uniref:Zinc-ribbon 15 domain-containing protein n=1 Tax=Alkaliphilus oremlandii (strain OhILAs) TaxID=350688 RepID=A8MKX1_ALKOO|nr:zinc ribbon domain-containing protein [Alkaliphilus oremlandii]ABW17788.1 conserved hypothetical protein [Alkaliphilus oremlandii OhILAs]